MKEFEKQFGTKEEAIEGYGLRDVGEYFGQRKGWKAAMKKVLEKCHQHQSQDVIDFILEELRKE